MRISLIIAGVLVVIGVVASLGVRGVAEYQRASGIDLQIAALQAEAEKLERKNALLEDRIAYFASEAHKEYVAKERLGYVREGEQMVVVTPKVLGASVKKNESEGGSKSDEQSAQNDTSDSDNIKKSWWRAIFGD